MMNLRTIIFLLTVLLCAVRATAETNLPLVQDFELSAGGFVPSSATSWKWGVPVVGPAGAHSGTQVWGTNLTSNNYSNDEDAVLTSPEYDLNGAAGKWIVVHWWQYLVTEYGFDKALVEVSRDGGGTWETVFGPRSGEVNAVWTQETLLLDPSYATESFQIRFRLISDSVGSQGGFFIDDLRLSAAEVGEVVPLQDFESGEGGFTTTGTNSSWAYGTPISAPGVAYSGLNAWATNLDGFYNADEDSVLTSPAFDVSGAAEKLLILSWWQYLGTEEGYDFAHLEVSKDDGVTWAPAQSAPVSGEVSAFGWMRKQAFIDPSYATSAFRFRFRLETDESYQYDGVAIDDVAILATSALFPSVSSFTKSTPQNSPISFKKSDFTTHYSDPDGGELESIVVLQLPASGTLRFGTESVTAGQSIPLQSLDSLRYDPPTDLSGVDSFAWTASNFFGPAVAGTVTLETLLPGPEIAITTDPEPQTVNPGTPVTFRVVAVSSEPMTYQWRKNQTPIGGAVGPAYMINAVSEGDEAVYDVVVDNGVDSVTSASAALSVNDPVAFTEQPESGPVTEGASITLRVVASGTGRLDFQWLKDGTAIPDATFSSLTIVDAKESDGGAYQCVVTNVVGSRTTAPATVSIRLKPRLSVGTTSRGISVPGKVKLRVEVEGTGPFTYQWLKDGVEIPGATGAVLTLVNGRSGDAGSYTVRVSNGDAESESEAIVLQAFQWKEIAGEYEDVIEAEQSLEGVMPFPGRLKVSLARSGTFSARLEYSGRTYRFKGMLNGALRYERKIKRAKQSPLQIWFQLDSTTRFLSASISHDEGEETVHSSSLLPQHVYHSRRNPAPQEGRYTVLLQPAEEAAVEAPGYVTLKASRSGRVRFRGKLPDGNVISGSGLIHFTSRVAVYDGLGAKKSSGNGELAGRLTLPDSATVAEAGGEVVWNKAAGSPKEIIPGPFVAPLTAIGSRYVAPEALRRVVALPPDRNLLELLIAGSFTSEPQQWWIRLTRRNKFLQVPKGPENIMLELRAGDGRIVGRSTDGISKKKYRFHGVVLQAQARMAGFIFDKNAPGAFTLIPAEE